MSNINQTVSKKTCTMAMMGLVLAATMSAAIAFQPSAASAQEVERNARLGSTTDRAGDAQDNRLALHSVKGAGIATDQETAENYRSGFRFVVQQVDGSANEFKVTRGLIGILVEGERVYYTLVPDTWTAVLSDDGLTFTASGQVKNGDSVFDVNLSGYFAMHTRLGNLWSINGELEGREHQYDLHYVGISNGIRAASADEIQ